MSTTTPRIGTARERQLRHLLQAERGRLARVVCSQRHDLQATGENEFESVRDATDVFESDIEDDLGFTVLELRTKTLADIDDALLRLDRGEYGRCVECGLDIAMRRLEAVPFAECCVSCEQDRERTFSQFPRLSSAYSGEDRVSGLD